MDKQHIFSMLQDMGYQVSYDQEGDIQIFYQLKQIFLLASEEDEGFVSLYLPQFHGIEDNEETYVLAACNKMTRDVKIAKVFVDHSYKNVSASCEFYYTDEHDLRTQVARSLGILGVVRSIFYETLQEVHEAAGSEE